MLGTDKFPSPEGMAAAIEASCAEIITAVLCRVDLVQPDGDILAHIDRERFLLLHNTSGARDAEEALRLARLARAAGLSSWIKLEVTPDARFLLPDPVAMGRAFRKGVEAGREAFLAGRAAPSNVARDSSLLTGFLRNSA